LYQMEAVWVSVWWFSGWFLYVTKNNITPCFSKEEKSNYIHLTRASKFLCPIHLPVIQLCYIKFSGLNLWRPVDNMNVSRINNQ
jgi:hypothetical protein